MRASARHRSRTWAHEERREGTALAAADRSSQRSTTSRHACRTACVWIASASMAPADRGGSRRRRRSSVLAGCDSMPRASATAHVSIRSPRSVRGTGVASGPGGASTREQYGIGWLSRQARGPARQRACRSVAPGSPMILTLGEARPLSTRAVHVMPWTESRLRVIPTRAPQSAGGSSRSTRAAPNRPRRWRASLRRSPRR